MKDHQHFRDCDFLLDETHQCSCHLTRMGQARFLSLKAAPESLMAHLSELGYTGEIYITRDRAYQRIREFRST